MHLWAAENAMVSHMCPASH